ncbi:glycosyltransferase family 2 protein [Candidatus Daviesbacteria bacterium]|nr:glycosyltransferase family 2 protein [Candidatus Daviesbacteria bacterium]
MKLSIIIPVYNEEKTIGELLQKVNNQKLPKGLIKEIIVVDDGSSDLTQNILKGYKNKMIKVFRHKENLGKGAAIRTGLEKVSGEICIIQDADLEYDPQDYQRLLDPILKDQTQVVYGTRLINYPLKFWGQEKTVLPLHLIANRFLTLLTNILYGSNLSDMETGYKLFRKKVLENIVVNSRKFDFEAEITAKILRQGIKIVEVPIKCKPRTYNEGKKISWKDGVSAIWTLFRYRLID